MKYTKMLGLLVVAAATLMAFTDIASATELTYPKGTKLPVGTKLKAEASGAISMTGTLTITCQKASGEGEITNAGGAGMPVEGVPVFNTITECGSTTVTTVQRGTAKLESIGGNTGTVFSRDTKVTVLVHNIFLGTIHCTYMTPITGIDIGTATGSNHGSDTTATLDISASVTKETATSDSACGSHATLEGKAILTSPDHVYID